MEVLDVETGFQLDSTVEPFASMTREDLVAFMNASANRAEQEFLNSILLSRISHRERAALKHGAEIARFLMAEYDVSAKRQCLYLCELAGRFATEIARDMPAMGAPEECN